MDANEKVKVVEKTSNATSIAVSKETRRRILQNLERINKKDFGRRLRVDEYVARALALMTPEIDEELRESCLSSADKLERNYREYVSRGGVLSKDQFLAKVMESGLGAAMSSVGAE
jgi:hypothetical protein